MSAILIAVLTHGSSSFLSVAHGAPLAPQPIAGGNNLYLMPAQFSSNTWGCYVMDIDSHTLCAYRYRPTNDGADLQLVAARKITYDLKLTQFNTEKPSPNEVKAMVEQQLRGRETTEPGK